MPSKIGYPPGNEAIRYPRAMLLLEELWSAVPEIGNNYKPLKHRITKLQMKAGQGEYSGEADRNIEQDIRVMAANQPADLTGETALAGLISELKFAVMNQPDYETTDYQELWRALSKADAPRWLNRSDPAGHTERIRQATGEVQEICAELGLNPDMLLENIRQKGIDARNRVLALQYEPEPTPE